MKALSDACDDLVHPGKPADHCKPYARLDDEEQNVIWKQQIAVKAAEVNHTTADRCRSDKSGIDD